MKVIKRDGREVAFDKEKIRDAVLAAFNDVDGEVTSEAKRKATIIANNIEALDQKSITVEEIQDIVERELMNGNRKDVAKAFIIYRSDRSRIREQNSLFFREVEKKIKASDVQNQNANVDEKSFGGRIGEASSELMRKYALDVLVSPMAKKNHEENMIYIHDLDQYAVGTHNCLSIPFDKLLANGFNTRQTDVRPANSVSTALQLVAVIFQLQSLQQFGGVAATHLDWTLVPYVRKSFFKHYKDGVKYIEDKELDYSFHDSLSIDEDDYKIFSPKAYKYAMDKTEKEVHQACEALLHNLNTLQSRSGNQLDMWLAS